MRRRITVCFAGRRNGSSQGLPLQALLLHPTLPAWTCLAPSRTRGRRPRNSHLKGQGVLRLVHDRKSGLDRLVAHLAFAGPNPSFSLNGSFRGFRSATDNAPIGRSGHTAVWTGSQMIVWGGRGLPQFSRHRWALLRQRRYLGHAATIPVRPARVSPHDFGPWISRFA